MSEENAVSMIGVVVRSCLGRYVWSSMSYVFKNVPCYSVIEERRIARLNSDPIPASIFLDAYKKKQRKREIFIEFRVGRTYCVLYTSEIYRYGGTR
jgi:hypothetical protein